MRMQTELMIALEPPGNIARDLAIFRRRLFAISGDASALAFPEIVPLAFASTASNRPSRRELEGCWAGSGGSFSSGTAIASRGLLYLSLMGPLESLCSHAAKVLNAGRPVAQTAAPLETGIGFFICRSPDPPRALVEAERIGLPRADFRDCSLILLGLRYSLGPGPEHEVRPFEALSWREFARA